MADIVKAYRQEIPAMRFIGKKYEDGDRVNGMFGAVWGTWFENGWFAPLESRMSDAWKSAYEDSDAYVGLMRWKSGEPFEYWVGMFAPADSDVPEGYAFCDFPAGALGVCWVYGKEPEVYGVEDKCAARLGKENLNIVADEAGAYWFFERYGCPRFTAPDEQGNIILDICHYVK
ncbi:MAG TPA: hypothetical protein PKE04_14230 [Clostridia bacterium]|nr:hypothetical protein [Clostridia bacterium]